MCFMMFCVLKYNLECKKTAVQGWMTGRWRQRAGRQSSGGDYASRGSSPLPSAAWGQASTSWAGVCSVGGPVGQKAVSPGATGGFEAFLSWPADGQSPACLSQVLTAGGGAGSCVRALGTCVGHWTGEGTVSPIQTSPPGAAVRLQPPHHGWGPHRQLRSVSIPSETGQRVSQGVPSRRS